MRKVINWNENWLFNNEEYVDLPHSWNSEDGYTGGNDYKRGTYIYSKILKKEDLPVEGALSTYIEINGANSSADLFVDDYKVAHHDGGYSTWRVNITDYLSDLNKIKIVVDNSPNEYVYPQMADFTFYGGLYRDVNLIVVSESHFTLDYYGGPGVKVTPVVEGTDARVEVEVYLDHPKTGQTLEYTISSRSGKIIEQVETPVSKTKVTMFIDDVHLWHGRKDPYLYRLDVKLIGEAILDHVSTSFGCRSFRIDPDEGFILNGEKYNLRGVSRHQDRKGYGNALKKEHHEEDIDLIMELGANSVRLAHYQHDQYFYDLCDEKGLIVWAEIPYISKHMPLGNKNTSDQLKELIIQNYNHPSIVVWSLSNEITMNGSDEGIIENHKVLNELAHQLDPTRLTTVACVTTTDTDDPYLKIPDVMAYNHYYGWYAGDTSMYEPWFDEFHRAHPDMCIGLSEYGCEGLDWHTSRPMVGDYTEEYQAHYHEEVIKQLFDKDYLWCTYVWNMFDFGADGRAEGGEAGQNHKGLVTFDRKYKKDAFYAYKAWLSDEPFVHLCSKRYIDRVEDVTAITVYSNIETINLYIDGKLYDTKTSKDHFFHFDVPNNGESLIEVVGDFHRDSMIIRKVDEMNETYILKDKNVVLNWFDISEVEGYCSLNDSLDIILKSDEGKALFNSILSKVMDGKGELGDTIDSMMDMLTSMTLLRLNSMIGQFGTPLNRDELLEVNKQLNKIKKL